MAQRSCYFPKEIWSHILSFVLPFKFICPELEKDENSDDYRWTTRYDFKKYLLYGVLVDHEVLLQNDLYFIFEHYWDIYLRTNLRIFMGINAIRNRTSAFETSKHKFFSARFLAYASEFMRSMDRYDTVNECMCEIQWGHLSILRSRLPEEVLKTQMMNYQCPCRMILLRRPLNHVFTSFRKQFIYEPYYKFAKRKN